MAGTVIEFPSVMHVRCTPEMLAEVKARGGGKWVRSLVAANSRPPTDAIDDLLNTGEVTPEAFPASSAGAPGKTRVIRSKPIKVKSQRTSDPRKKKAKK